MITRRVVWRCVLDCFVCLACVDARDRYIVPARSDQFAAVVTPTSDFIFPSAPPPTLKMSLMARVSVKRSSCTRYR